MPKKTRERSGGFMNTIDMQTTLASLSNPIAPRPEALHSQKSSILQNNVLGFSSESTPSLFDLQLSFNTSSNLRNNSNVASVNPPAKKKRVRAPVLRRPVCTFEGCNMSFSTSGHLARHFKIHSGIKTHACPIEGCEKRFARKDNMMHHFSTHKKKLESKGVRAVLVASAQTKEEMQGSPTATLFSEMDHPSSDPDKDTISSVTSGRTAASVSPSNSFIQTKSALPSEFPSNSLPQARRPKSAPLCNINTSANFLNNYSAQPPLSASSVFVNHSLLGPRSSINTGRDFPTFDIAQTFFDSAAFPTHTAPMSAPPVSFSPFDTQLASQMNLQANTNKIPNPSMPTFDSASTSLENINAPENSLLGSTLWNPNASEQFDQYFSSFFESNGDRKRSISLEGTSLIGRSAVNAWSSFSLDF